MTGFVVYGHIFIKRYISIQKFGVGTILLMFLKVCSAHQVKNTVKSIITPAFGVTWSFRNHSNVLELEKKKKFNLTHPYWIKVLFKKKKKKKKPNIQNLMCKNVLSVNF